MRLIDADALMPKLKFIREAEHQIYGKGSWEFASKCITAIEDAPTAHPELDEWCTDCKEYDHERHCCPRFNRVIRQTLKDTQPKKGKWVDEMGNRKTSGYCATCTACGEWSEYITDYCPNCGAHMVEGEDGDENG